MGKYDPLGHYLEGQSADSIDANFTQLEDILGFTLPPSAYRHQAWWANEAHGSHSHSRSWQNAGWETANVDTNRRTVRFQRRKSDTVNPPTRSQLWEQAAKLSGIAEQDELIEAALLALIQREAALALARMGGSMPDLVVPERERPFA